MTRTLDIRCAHCARYRALDDQDCGLTWPRPADEARWRLVDGAWVCPSCAASDAKEGSR